MQFKQCVLQTVGGMSGLVKNMSLLVSSPTTPIALVSHLSYGSRGIHGLSKVPISPRKTSFHTHFIKCFITDRELLEKPFNREVCRKDFPADFMFGASSSALQTEGINGGRGPNTWDMMIQGTTAVDSYNLYKEDVKMLKYMSADCYRFSISWSRILPKGTLNGGINQDGIDFYNNLINELVNNNVQPFVTLFHCDLPEALQNDYHGFLSKRIVNDFKDFVEICFRSFGDRVKYWTSFNEPQVMSLYGYLAGLSIDNDPTTMPYMVAHNILLAHAVVAKLYEEKYQGSQGGEFGLPLMAQGFFPFSGKPCDQDAAQRASDFSIGWFLEPLVTGDYPFIMRAIVRDRLPTFTDEEKEMVKGSFDFISINYYTSRYARGQVINANDKPTSYDVDQYVTLSVEDKEGVPIGPLPPGDTHAYTCPKELKDLLIQLKNRYENPKIFISENGIMEPRDDTIPLPKALEDPHRINYIKDHLKSVREAMSAGVNVKGYCVWSLHDVMELGAGYTVRMGLFYTDYLDNLKRIPKDSAKWFRNFLTAKN